MADKKRLVDVSIRGGGVMVLRLANPKKLNAWSVPMLKQVRENFDQAAKDDEVKALVVTGTGKYYCAGVDLAALLKPMAPKALVSKLKTLNQGLFDQWIDFPKPVFSAMNGPCIGAAATTATLADGIICNEKASMVTPFASLGLVPEGCSSYLFPKLLGDDLAHKMLEQGYKLGAQEALERGLVAKLVETNYPDDSTEEDTALLAKAEEHAREFLDSNTGRSWSPEELETLKRVNAEESIALANALVSEKFFRAMEANAERRNNTAGKTIFQALRLTRPVWKFLL